MEETGSESLSANAGIAADYINALGQRQSISPHTIQRLLDAMGYTAQPGPADAAPLPPVRVYRQKTPYRNGPDDRHWLIPGGQGNFRWWLHTEQGRIHHGKIAAGQRLSLPVSLPPGYHRLTLNQNGREWHCQIIIAPRRCYEPDELLAERKLWGTCVQLYTLRSEHNWGIGDTGDLKQLIREIARRGGSFVGLNPIHALYPTLPDNASPYSPSSRRWLNTLYIDVGDVEDFQLSPAARAWWARGETRRALEEVRASPGVDYRRVAALKYTALRLAWQQFNRRAADDVRRRDFEEFVRRGGDSLRYQGIFDALQGQLIARDKGNWSWQVWPEEYRDARGPAIEEFCRHSSGEIAFYIWLQWLADRQFNDCFALCRTLEMPIGLYRDLAVGVSDGGAETWSEPALYCLRASVGAPPDVLGPRGQNWGLAPMSPHEMASRGYQPFIDLLRANMRGCGALRIDHVMSLLRLWWIPLGDTAGQGAYIHYPVDDLLAILALESQRNHCMVIGEDLGTVPQEIVSRLFNNGIYSYKVLYFEQDDRHVFRPPSGYPSQSMATLTTHDLPTLRGYWTSDDLRLGRALGLYSDDGILSFLHQDRRLARQGLLDALHRQGSVPERTRRQADRLLMSPVLNRGMHLFLADSASALLGLQPEDWLDMAEPVNVPGTSDEYPNWRRKLSRSLDEIFADSSVNRLLREINRRRGKAG
ncbi:4-alpha-glucanotransferase [Sodalis ligni]|uniref:4-alpha-glucanotransferase n=1 Tax=Sodalis ligni TaxID=2697027 RepID=A0A4R1NEE3_9GAMM|nr:4-alpha-glucanotransferase [Sodalis ligni]TCL05955.1 4-alpha-glucanotransferase [Sodalis ligni]